MSETEKEVLKTLESGVGLTGAEQEILVNYIDKLQKEIEDIKEYVNSSEFLDWNLGFKLIDELEYRKDRINKLLGDKV